MPDDGVPRDRFGRPLIRIPGEEKLQPYKRASSFGKPLDDLNNIIAWKQRLTAKGLVENPHLQLSIAAAGDDKRELNKVVEQAFLAAGGQTKAEIGTSLHSLCEYIDRQEPWQGVPYAYRGDLIAYEFATRGFEYLAIEEFVVQDDIRAAGTPDRIIRYKGENFIGDIKTGGIGFPHGFSVQLAIYAHSVGYDFKTEERKPLPDLNTDKGIIVHLPAGEGVCTLHWIDLKRGWEACRLAAEVDAWRKQKKLTEPIELEAV